MNIDSQIDQAKTLHQQGRLHEASLIYEAVLKIDPKHAESMHLLGLVEAQSGKHELAVNWISQALAISPENAKFHNNLGTALVDLKQYVKAIASFDLAVQYKPDYADAYFNKGLALIQLKDWGSAAQSLQQALVYQPGFFEALYLLGNTLQELVRFDEAITTYQKSIAINKNYAPVFYNLGNAYKAIKQFESAVENYEKSLAIDPSFVDAYVNLGIALKETYQTEKAIENYKLAISFDPKSSQAYYNLANVFKQLKNHDKALENYDLAIALNPSYHEAFVNKGAVLADIRQYKLAIENYNKAIELNHDNPEAFFNRANSLALLKKYDEAKASFDIAISYKRDYADAYWNKSLLLLTLQDFKRGWALYDWRWTNERLGFPALSSSKPKVNRLPSNDGKKLLVWAEQGVGDQVLYSGMLDQLLSIAPASQISLDNRLLPLMRRSFPLGNFSDEKNSIDEAEYDEHLPIADLGKYFRTCRDDFDTDRTHYLVADGQRASEIRKSLIGKKKFLCGINWSSKAESTGAEKSIQLEDLLSIFAIDQIAFVSVQYGNVHEQLIGFNKKHNLNIKECSSVDNFHDLDGHAALLEACDFVVTISNTSAHMSGAIGKETYLMCPSANGLIWYWSNQFEGKSLWYPSIRIYEQTVPGRWLDVVQRVRLAIDNKLNA